MSSNEDSSNKTEAQNGLKKEDANKSPENFQTVKVDNILGWIVLGNFLGTFIAILPYVVVVGVLVWLFVLPALEKAIDNISSSSSSP